MTSTVSDYGDVLQSQTRESYSVEQRRAKIQFKLAYKDRSYRTGEFYYDSKTSAAIMLDGSSFIAKISSPKQLGNLINMVSLGEDESEQQVADDFIVGHARLLFFLERHRSEMKLSSVRDFKRRNVRCLRYDLSYATKSGSTLKFRIYYSEVALSADKDSLPMQVIIDFGPDGGNLLRTDIDFSSVEILNPSGEPSAAGKLPVYDRFAYRLAKGFSDVLTTKAPEDLFENRPFQLTRFSFRAEDPSNDIECLVAFDGRLDSLRFDLIDSSAYSRSKKQIFNFKLNRMYHTVERVANSEGTLDRVLNLSQAGAEGDNEATSSSSQCMIAKITTSGSKEYSERMTMGKILAGAERFVYMGRAQVRGVATKFYEATDANLPFWLEQPIVYRKIRGDENIRRAGEFLRDPESLFTFRVVLHFAEQDVNHPLMLIEIHKLGAKSLVSYAKRTIFIHGFSWDLDFGIQESSSSQNELFSLWDLCAKTPTLSRYTQVNMLLKTSDLISPAKTDITDSSEINSEPGDPSGMLEIQLALLGAMQSVLKVPATMVYDMSARIISQAGLTEKEREKAQQVMAVSFKLSEHSERLVEAIYLGQGVPDNGISLAEKDQIYSSIRSFQACFFFASHRSQSVFFAFNPNLNLCYIDLSSASTSPDASNQGWDWPAHFTKNPSETMEVYRTNFLRDGNIQSNGFLHDLDRAKSQANLLGIELTLRGLVGGAEAHLTINKLKVEDNKRGSKPSADTSGKFPGFGLVETSPGNRRVAAALLSSGNWSPLKDVQASGDKSTMTYEQCNAACLSNFECQSFSLCLRSSELECVISTVNFGEPNAVSQLQELAAAHSSNVVIKLGDEKQVQLHRSNSCTLYNVNFLDLFHKSSLTFGSISKRLIHGVSNREHCAKLCIKHSLNVLQDIQVAAATSRNLFESPQTSDPDYVSTLNRMLQEHKAASNRVCKSIYYLSRGKISDMPEHLVSWIETRALPEEGVAEIGGYCMLDAEAEQIDEEEEKRSLGDVAPSKMFTFLKAFNFKFENFYEKQHGVRMLASRLSEPEREAHKQISLRKLETNQDTYATILSVVERGDNIQEKLHNDITDCARFCFLQAWGPWPACRSFDIVVDLSSAEGSVKCYLNSVSLNQAVAAQRTDLISDESASDQLQVWHFEPRPGYALEQASLNCNVEMAASNLFKVLSAQEGSQINIIALWFIVLLAFTGGSFLGLQLGSRFTRRPQTRPRNDEETLVAKHRVIEFINQVNHEGNLAE